jgi:D-glycero-D-manno-heptose 1,7-bisphosphate phosphatase
MRALGLGLVVVTNQSAVGRGLIDEERLARIHGRMAALLADDGVSVDGVYHCPHTPDALCRCRKPQTGLLERAARELGFDPGAGVVIGDKACDIELGQRVGATTMLVRTGYGAEVEAAGEAAPDYVVDDLWSAARIIEHLMISNEKARSDAVQQRLAPRPDATPLPRGRGGHAVGNRGMR